jgi:hypothetical protein
MDVGSNAEDAKLTAGRKRQHVHGVHEAYARKFQKNRMKKKV